MIAFDRGEQIQYVARRHNLAFILEVVFLLITAIFPYLISFQGLTDWLLNFFNPGFTNLFFLKMDLYCLWLLFVWILFFIAWSDYYLDVWIITDGRVIDVEQTGIFRRRVHYYRLDKLSNIQIDEPSYLEKTFQYGNVCANVEGVGKLIIAEVPNPNRVRDLILNNQKKVLERLQKNIQFEEGK